MERKVLSEMAQFRPDKHVHVVLFNGKRTKVLLLCLAPGLTVPPHSHAGYEVTLQPIRGKAMIPGEDGTETLVEPGQVYFADGAASFNPRNPFDAPFEMLIHLVKKDA